MNGYVRYQRGLRQGDLLYPLLFILVTNVLSTMFNSALSLGVLYGVPLRRFSKICHLQYADDLIILMARDAEDL